MLSDRWRHPEALRELETEAVQERGLRGVRPHDAAQPQLIGNRVRNNLTDIDLRFGGNTQADSNHVSRNGLAIELQGFDSGVILRNTVFRNGYGIRATRGGTYERRPPLHYRASHSP